MGFAEMIYGTGERGISETGKGIGEAISQAAELGLKQEQLQQARAAHTAKLQEIEMAKWEKGGKLYETYDKLPEGPAKQNMGRKFIPAYFRAAGLSESFNPAVAEMQESDPELGVFLASRASAGEVTQAEIAEAVRDPEKYLQLVTRLGYGKWADEKKLAGTLQRYGPEIAKGEEAARARRSQEKIGVRRGDGTQDRHEERISLTKEDTIRKDVNKISDGYTQTQQQLAEAEGHVRGGDTRQVSMIIASIARNVGEQKGSLSDGDVKRSIPPDVATDVSGLLAYLNSNQKISKPLQGALLRLIDGARTKSTGIAKQAIERRRKQYSSGSYRDLMQEGEAGNIIFSEAESMFPKQSGKTITLDNGDVVQEATARRYIEQNPDTALGKMLKTKLGVK